MKHYQKFSVLVLGVLSRCSAAERSVRTRKTGGKLSESAKADEFLTPPRLCTSRGQPQAKLLGGFSLVRFFVPHKEMNIKYLTF